MHRHSRALDGTSSLAAHHQRWTSEPSTGASVSTSAAAAQQQYHAVDSAAVRQQPAGAEPTRVPQGRYQVFQARLLRGWLGSRVVSVLDSGTVGFKSQPRRCRVTVFAKTNRFKNSVIYYSLNSLQCERSFLIICLQCFDPVGWAAGRASGL